MGQNNVIIFHRRRGGRERGKASGLWDVGAGCEKRSSERIDVFVGTTIKGNKIPFSTFVFPTRASSIATKVHEMIDEVTS